MLQGGFLRAEHGGSTCRYFNMPDHDMTVTVALSGGFTCDLTGDGKTDNADLTVLLRHVAKIAPLTGENLKRANVDGKGGVDAADVKYMAKLLRNP